MELAGKRIVVTGGVKGLGRATVEKLLARGAHVAVIDVDEAGLNNLQTEHNGVQCIRCDVTNADQVLEVAAQYQRDYRSPDVVINNAGILYSSPLIRLTPSGIERHDVQAWNKVLAADLHSVFYVTSAFVEAMVRTRTRGVIVNVSSVCAAGNAGQSAYSAAKAGVNALTATWAKELAPLGIRVMAIAPGYTETQSTTQAMSQGVLDEIVKRVPLRRLGKPDEIATGILSLIENDFFHGKILELDGGLIV